MANLQLPRKTKSAPRHWHKNVRKVVSDLNGQIDICYTDDTFHVNILLPNYE